ncbi:MAG: hypothetical protein KA314_07700 [Chloroflexi bacterium]|nr:hypothetical protein [Chloroflexota bacterium]
MSTLTVHHLNRLSLPAFRRLFRTLSAPLLESLCGEFHSEIVGPAWMRWIAPPALVMGGLGGWRGKLFDDTGQGVNLVNRRGQMKQVLPMQLARQASLIDQQPVIAVTYAASAPPPWPWIIDELRQLNAQTVLGMTVATRLGLHRVAFPFLLHKKS